MRFRPCIDIHNGKVKQIVGGSLKDAGDQARENFVSEQDAAFYAALYRDAGLRGGQDSPDAQPSRRRQTTSARWGNRPSSLRESSM